MGNSNDTVIPKSLNVLQFKAERIVSGLHTAHCTDALAHAKQAHASEIIIPNHLQQFEEEITRNTYNVYVQAYLPQLENDFPAPLINILPDITPVETEVNIETDVKTALAAREIQIVYVSRFENIPPFSLWSFFIQYSISEENSVPLIKIALRNTDPETTRGTVTTVEDTDDGNS